MSGVMRADLINRKVLREWCVMQENQERKSHRFNAALFSFSCFMWGFMMILMVLSQSVQLNPSCITISELDRHKNVSSHMAGYLVGYYWWQLTCWWLVNVDRTSSVNDSRDWAELRKLLLALAKFILVISISTALVTDGSHNYNSASCVLQVHSMLIGSLAKS